MDNIIDIFDIKTEKLIKNFTEEQLIEKHEGKYFRQAIIDHYAALFPNNLNYCRGYNHIFIEKIHYDANYPKFDGMVICDMDKGDRKEIEIRKELDFLYYMKHSVEINKEEFLVQIEGIYTECINKLK